MGFYLRKSLRAGPFRFNLSKSGLGVSAGIPGFRVGTGPRGNYVHVGAAGVYYRASLSGRARPGVPHPEPSPVDYGWAPPPQPEILMEDTTGATATQLLPSDADEFVSQLNQAAKRMAAWPYALGVTIVLALALGSPIGIVLLIVAAPGIAWLFLRDRARKSVVAFYQVDGPQSQWFQSAVDAFAGLAQSAAVWRINAAGDVTTTHQYKVNAGANTIIKRDRVTVTDKGPKVLVTNIAVPSIQAGRHSLHLLPDRLLVRDGRRFASVSFGAMQARSEMSRFIEDGSVPRDAQRVDTTWRYVNVKGGPDRRFNNNRQLPVMLYGRVTLTTSTGLRWIIEVSRTDSSARVAGALSAAKAPQPIAAPAPG